VVLPPGELIEMTTPLTASALPIFSIILSVFRFSTITPSMGIRAMWAERFERPDTPDTYARPARSAPAITMKVAARQNVTLRRNRLLSTSASTSTAMYRASPNKIF